MILHTTIMYDNLLKSNKGFGSTWNTWRSSKDESAETYSLHTVSHKNYQALLQKFSRHFLFKNLFKNASIIFNICQVFICFIELEDYVVLYFILQIINHPASGT